MSWEPTAALEALRGRARVLETIRTFFRDRGVLEVETPILGSGAVPDLHLHPPSTELDLPASVGGRRRLWLRTSPELPMKRLLAAGSGPIYELGRCFRDGEAGRLHNPEFTMLEWYRPGWDHHRLANEVEALLGEVLGTPAAERTAYAELFGRIGVDPHRDDPTALAAVAEREGLDARGLGDADRDTWLQLLLSHVLEPELGRGRPAVVDEFPASQAALARTRRRADGVEVADRFEVWLEGVELANGYHELVDPDEQERRFRADLERRRGAGLAPIPLDERFLAALRAGMPEGSGVALGVDRLVMLALGRSSLSEVLAFPVARA